MYAKQIWIDSQFDIITKNFNLINTAIKLMQGSEKYVIGTMNIKFGQGIFCRMDVK